MPKTVISVEHLTKRYELGVINTGTLSKDINRWWARLRGKPDPYQKIGEPEYGNRKGDSLLALNDVSFQVQQGEALGIIGRNGAGKSTLLKILSRVTAPTSGKVKMNGRVGSLLEVGTGFHPELTGRENIYLNGAILGMSRKEVNRKFDEIVDFSGVEQFIDTPVKRYSSGMYVRLAFAVAAHLEPEILIVDEVLAVGDAEFQKKCLGKMGDVAEEGHTVLFVSHNMTAIEKLCKKCLLIQSGKIEEYDTDVHRVIIDYLFSNSEKDNSGFWINRNNKYINPYFQPLSLSLVDENEKRILEPIPNTSNMWVQIEAIIEQIDPSLTIGYALYNENDILLYWSYQTDCDESEWLKIYPGKWRLKSKIPPRFLNEGKYRIDLIGGLHFRKWLFEPLHDVPSISFSIQGGLSDSPLWITKRPCVLAPVFPWTGNEMEN